MVRVLFPWCDSATDKTHYSDDPIMEIILAAIESEDVELIKWTLPKYKHGRFTSLDYGRIIVSVIQTNSFEVFDVWEDSLQQLNEDGSGHALFTRNVLLAAKKRPAMEKRLMETWKMLVTRKQLSKWSVCCGLGSISESSLSIPQAKVLLELGANINHPRRPWRRHGLTHLHTALKKSTAEGAEFVKFLLMNGANPEYGYGKREVDWEIGAINISQWLGISWDELIESTQEFRKGDSDDEETP